MHILAPRFVCYLQAARVAAMLLGIYRLISCPPPLYQSSIRHLSEFELSLESFKITTIYLFKSLEGFNARMTLNSPLFAL